MKKLMLSMFIVISQSTVCLAEEAVAGLEQALKQPGHEPNFMSIVFALGFVILLIYVTGIIYSKLNLVGAKAVQEQLKNYDLTKTVVLSTTQLGQGKNLHVIEINNKRYLIGATQNSISLIKELGEIEKKFSKEKEPEATVDEAIEVLYGEEKKDLASAMEKVEEFDVHKKYL
ncbi:MAG: flagellar biosynthetic protein FliO [Candidatus Gastranaerophilales bacterium]|nr:flagellar biosynthetic protein FliO [Candidatus Gastranaerophilales bacterium]